MNPNMLNDLCASVVRRLSLRPTTVEAALLVTLHHFCGESHNPAVAYIGLTPDQYVLRSLSTPASRPPSRVPPSRPRAEKPTPA